MFDYNNEEIPITKVINDFLQTSDKIYFYKLYMTLFLNYCFRCVLLYLVIYFVFLVFYVLSEDICYYIYTGHWSVQSIICIILHSSCEATPKIINYYLETWVICVLLIRNTKNDPMCDHYMTVFSLQ